jgi:hypothetical protein
MSESASVRINTLTGEIEVRGSENFVEKMLPEAHVLLAKQLTAGLNPSKPGSPILPIVPETTQPLRDGMSFSEFIQSKKIDRNTKGEDAMTAFVFFLTNIQGLESATTEQLLVCFDQAGVPKPSNVNSTISNLKGRRGFLVSAGRGAVKLSVPGENFVKFTLGVEA